MFDITGAAFDDGRVWIDCHNGEYVEFRSTDDLINAIKNAGTMINTNKEIE